MNRCGDNCCCSLGGPANEESILGLPSVVGATYLLDLVSGVMVVTPFDVLKEVYQPGASPKD